MENIQNREIPAPTPEELKQEEESLSEVKEDEVRASIIEKLGLDKDEQSDLIDKLTESELEQRKSFSTAIKQKRKWRDLANKKEDKPEPKPKEDAPDIDKLLDEKLEKRDLDSLDLSDELKEKVRTYAKVNDTSIKSALNSDYIKFEQGKEETARSNEEASLGGKRRAGLKKKDLSELNANDFDMTTPEGRQEWEEAQEKIKEQIG